MGSSDNNFVFLKSQVMKLIEQWKVLWRPKNFGRHFLDIQVFFFYTGGPTLTIFAITRFLIIEKILRLARKRHTLWSYKPVPLFYLLSIGFRVKRR
jgi:hypothetical protein